MMEWLEPSIQKRVNDIIENEGNDVVFDKIETSFCQTFKLLGQTLKEQKQLDLLYLLENNVNLMMQMSVNISYRRGLCDGMDILHNKVKGG